MAKQKQTQTIKQDRPLAQTAAKERLSCDLTLDEQRERGAELAQLLDELDLAEAEKESVTKRHKAAVDAVASRVSDMATIVRSKKEYRSVDVVTVHDPYRCLHETTRIDTGEVIRTVTMSREEVAKLLQVELPLTSRRLDEETLLEGSNDDGAR